MKYQHPQKLENIANDFQTQAEESSLAMQLNSKEMTAMQKKNSLVDKFCWLADLSASKEKIDWIWEGFIASKQVTLLSAEPKTGKTTLLSWMFDAHNMNVKFLGYELKKIKILIVSEESSVIWSERRTIFGLYSKEIAVICRPIIQSGHNEWLNTLKTTKGLCLENNIKLVIFDTLANFWSADDENSSSKVIKALKPLHSLTEAGLAVLLVHHDRKSGGDHGSGARGSNALTGFTDININLKRGDSASQRVIKTQSRFEETPQELVIELTDHGYIVRGTQLQVKQQNKIDLILPHLPDEPSGITIKELKEKAEIRSDNSTISRWLHDAQKKGLTKIIGKSTDKGTPDLWAKKKDEFQSIVQKELC